MIFRIHYNTFLTLKRLGFLRVVFFPIGLPFIFQEEFVQYQYNFIQFLNNLFKVCWKWKNADIIWYKLM